MSETAPGAGKPAPEQRRAEAERAWEDYDREQRHAQRPHNPYVAYMSGFLRGDANGFRRAEVERHICTKDNPWPWDRKIRAYHPDANVVDSDCDCCVAYVCPYCGLHFKVELPE